jgi:hypothetical protein
VPVELEVDLVELPVVVAVAKVLADVEAFALFALVAVVALEVKVLAVDDVWMRTFPEVLEAVLEPLEAALEAVEEAPDETTPLEELPLPEPALLVPQTPLDLMLW